ncbi:MAG: hypothetical protein KDD69_05730 [Bdellovibrionales bacterium]|nr:hypothetical protein [Bdellovibrionales bacterium]
MSFDSDRILAAHILRQISPADAMAIARLVMMLELRDRRGEAQFYIVQGSDEHASALKELSAMSIRAETRWLTLLVGLLRAAALLLASVKLLSKPLFKASVKLERRLIEASTADFQLTRARELTQDEVVAQEQIEHYKQKVEALRQAHPEDQALRDYLDRVMLTAMEFGQEWAENEIEYRRAVAYMEREEASYRASFLVSSFGFGALSLIWQLFGILALSLALPFAAQLFIRQAPDYSVWRNIVIAFTATTGTWIVTVCIRLYFNDRRMAQSHKRAQVGLNRAKHVRARGIYESTDSMAVRLRELLGTFAWYNDKSDPLCVLCEDSIKLLRIRAQVHADMSREAQADLAQLNGEGKKQGFLERMQAAVDRAAQGDLVG